MSDLNKLVEDIAAIAEQAADFAVSENNKGPYSHEIFLANVQISGALHLLANRIRDRLNAQEKTNERHNR